MKYRCSRENNIKLKSAIYTAVWACSALICMRWCAEQNRLDKNNDYYCTLYLFSAISPGASCVSWGSNGKQDRLSPYPHIADSPERKTFTNWENKNLVFMVAEKRKIHVSVTANIWGIQPIMEVRGLWTRPAEIPCVRSIVDRHPQLVPLQTRHIWSWGSASPEPQPAHDWAQQRYWCQRIPAGPRTPVMGNSGLGSPHRPSQNFLRQYCSLFQPNSPSFFLSFNRCQTCIGGWSFPTYSCFLPFIFHRNL